MVVYGVALLSVCMLLGLYLGNMLGELLGVQANIGGVGIAILLLVTFIHFHGRRGGSSGNRPFKLHSDTAIGISFWSAMYIPIIVAMTAKQNVLAAVSAGPVALVAGVLSVVASFALIPVLTRWGQSAANKGSLGGNSEPDSNKQERENS